MFGKNMLSYEKYFISLSIIFMSDSNSSVITLSPESIDILINASEHCLFKSFRNLQKIDADLAWVLLMDFTSSPKYHMPDPTLY